MCDNTDYQNLQFGSNKDVMLIDISAITCIDVLSMSDVACASIVAQVFINKELTWNWSGLN